MHFLYWAWIRNHSWSLNIYFKSLSLKLLLQFPGVGKLAKGQVINLPGFAGLTVSVLLLVPAIVV